MQNVNVKTNVEGFLKELEKVLTLNYKGKIKIIKKNKSSLFFNSDVYKDRVLFDILENYYFTMIEEEKYKYLENNIFFERYSSGIGLRGI